LKIFLENLFKFLITKTFNLLDDILPPIVTINKGLKVIEGKSAYLSRSDLDIKDADTSFSKLFFTISKHAKYGRLENIKEPGMFRLFYVF